MKFAAAIVMFIAGASAIQSETEMGFGGFAGGRHGVHLGGASFLSSTGGPHQAHVGATSSKGGVKKTYADVEGRGYGLYDLSRKEKPRLGTDGYRVKERTDPHKRLHGTVNAVCTFGGSHGQGGATVHFTQGPKDKGTRIYGGVGGDMTIGSLGDLRHGCDGTGMVWNPFIGTIGYGYSRNPVPSPGALGQIQKTRDSSVDIWADVDLSGTHSIIGRSLGNGHSCCVIGLQAGSVYVAKPVYKQKTSYQQQSYQPAPHAARAGYGGYQAPAAPRQAGYGGHQAPASKGYQAQAFQGYQQPQRAGYQQPRQGYQQSPAQAPFYQQQSPRQGYGAPRRGY